MSHFFHQHDFERTLAWLVDAKLARRDFSITTARDDIDSELLAHPIKRNYVRRTQEELNMARRRRQGQGLIRAEAAYEEAERIRAGSVQLEWTRYPCDAIAFYRPFHYSQPGEWGIYFDAAKLLNYAKAICNQLGEDIHSFTFDSLLTACFCEIFQHEYFHHISECAATTLEVMLAQAGVPQPVYMNYFENRFHHDHVHAPLEEALANAYAYNSLTFLSRVKKGLRTTRVATYQSAMKKLWLTEPPGYREAGSYVGASYIDGAGRLLTLMLDQGGSPPFARDLIAKEVLLNGNATFFAKPEIPVYICGTAAAISKFNRYVPAPVEAYTSLTWLDDSSEVDAYFEAKRKVKTKEKKEKGQSQDES